MMHRGATPLNDSVYLFFWIFHPQYWFKQFLPFIDRDCDCLSAFSTIQCVITERCTHSQNKFRWLQPFFVYLVLLHRWLALDFVVNLDWIFYSVHLQARLGKQFSLYLLNLFNSALIFYLCIIISTETFWMKFPKFTMSHTNGWGRATTPACVLCKCDCVANLAGAEKSPQRSELGFGWTTVLKLPLSSSSKQPAKAQKQTVIWMQMQNKLQSCAASCGAAVM